MLPLQRRKEVLLNSWRSALSAELVNYWIDAFPMTVHVSDRVDYIYMDTANLPGQSQTTQIKEELPHRRVIDAADSCLIVVAVEKYPHTLEHQRPYLHSPVMG